ncbi:3'-5' exonuclease [Marinobacterium rhizophilum]|uniref:Exonuclease n=1 Tax=Marinobacterium rhizophilum TaxID=420402 RepID=A0ABY5HNC6_9GAMM|nr:hypothetical protein [Marinobacterium rhizophilum]UTW13793.1 hypothetical protein KDW95_09220 [Marinobacterium rhizophilum]
MDIICLDFEASGLGPRSYPIEVAWRDAASGEQDSFLIDPNTVPGWTHWDEVAQGIHGLSREELHAQGIAASAACWRLNRALEGRTVYCDALEFDHFWLRRLYEAAQMRPMFRLKGLEVLLTAVQRQRFMAAIECQDRRHRALDDVADLIGALQYAFQGD